MTRDPVPGAPSLPATLNPYAYSRNNPALYVDPSGKFAFIPLLIVGLAGGMLGGLGYYAIQAYMHADPCTGRMNWDWNQALQWGTIGMALGGALVAIPYGGWWVGTQLGWWGTTIETTATTAATSACADGDCTNEAQTVARIVEKGWTVLGRYPGYLQKAKEYGANVFSIKEWTWEKNVQYLDEAMARGERFLLETPFVEGMKAKGTVYRDELIYVIQRGYELITLHGQDWLVPIE